MNNMNDTILSNMMNALVRLLSRDTTSIEQHARIKRLSRIIGRALNVSPEDIMEEACAQALEQGE